MMNQLKQSNLLIISHTPHYIFNKKIVGWGATVREINHLAKLFKKTVHVAPIYNVESDQSALEYESASIKVRKIPGVGGKKIWSKFKVLFYVPNYIVTLLQEIKSADVIQVRCPCNIGLIAILVLACMRDNKIRWVKYAGNWAPAKVDYWSCRFQRWLLRLNVHRGIVTVNGTWPNERPHVLPFYNPCLDQSEIEEAAHDHSKKTISDKICFIFVGSLTKNKGADRVLKIVSEIGKRNLNYQLDMIGDGQDRKELEQKAREYGINHHVTFHGWKSREELSLFYKKAHFILLPSKSEGWPKVISEAMAYGVIPLVSNVSCIPFMLTEFKTGKCFDGQDIEGFVTAIIKYLKNPATWLEESKNGVKAAQSFTYDYYLKNIKERIIGQN